MENTKEGKEEISSQYVAMRSPMAAIMFGCLGGVKEAREKRGRLEVITGRGTVRNSQLFMTDKVQLDTSLKCQGLFLLLSHDFPHVMFALLQADMLFL